MALYGLQYQIKRAAFGLLNVSSVVQRSITSLFADLDYCVHYNNDIYVATDDSIDNHVRCLQTVLSRLTRSNLHINHEKLNLMQKSTFVLGFRLSHDALTLSMRKVTNVLSWPETVQNSKELSHRLGVINCFREHVPRISTLMAPLNNLKNHPNIKEVWTAEHSKAMRTLQLVLADTPVLSCPNLKYPLHLVTDASAYGIGGCLYQVFDNKIRYIGFVARTLSKAERNYGSSRREILAFLYCTTKWKQWLSGQRFHYYTDNIGVLYLHTQTIINRIIGNYYEMIYEFDFDITFCAGVRNILADHLSRLLYPEDADQTLERGEQVIDTQVETKAASEIAKESRDNLPHVTLEINSENNTDCEA
ncbi:Transposon Ty3-I Gag-Pol polyprotein [Choanephora cucurbitarum]|uniref:Transposon Ty3-I Gag-Pol polyprotein n=1 Tax=Choanephora cucurbitarum TaxID=101091 RepID=A0A1C7MXM2_9FUNG|nr:Transposon Ty3-I Gag-Pol polyprotein [Choanephora cucurbitarum]